MSKSRIKKFGLVLIVMVIAVSVSACFNIRDGGDGTDEVIDETNSLNDILEEDIGYNTKIPAEYEVITNKDLPMLSSIQKLSNKTIKSEAITTEEVLTQQTFFTLEINFFAGPNVRALLEADEDEYNDKEKIFNDFGPFLIGLSLNFQNTYWEEQIKDAWSEIYGDKREVEKRLKETNDTINEIDFKTIDGREALLVEYSNHENNITITTREWSVLAEEKGKLISLNYMDIGNEVTNIIVDYAVENLELDS